MPFAPYRAVLSVPGVLRLLLFGVLARVPQTASGIVLSLHVVGPLDRGWAAAGLVGTASTIGMAIGAPWRGRAVDRVGLRRAMLPSVLVAVAVGAAAPFVGYRTLLVLAVVGGVLSLPIFTVMRQSLAVMVPVERRRTAMALDSISVELSFMAGPALGVLLATGLSTEIAIIVVGGCTALAGVALMVFNPPTRSVVDAADLVEQLAGGQLAGGQLAGGQSAGGPLSGAQPPDEHQTGVPAPSDRRRAMLQPAMLTVLGTAAAATIVLAGTDVSVVAHLRAADALPLTGLVFLAWGIGSILGGLVYGALQRPVSPLLLLLGLGLLTLPVGLAPSPYLLALTMLPASALCAPVVTATSEAIVRLVPEAVRGEAMGWHGSAMTVGVAVGSPLAGAAIDVNGPWAGFTAVGALGAVLAVVGFGTLRLRRIRAARPATA